MKLENLNVKDWPLEESFNVVSDFLDSMPGNVGVSEAEMIIRASSLSSVTLSRTSLLYGSRVQIYQTQNKKLEILEQQMDENQSFWHEAGYAECNC